MIPRVGLAAIALLTLMPAPAQAEPAGDDLRWSVQPSTAQGPDGRDWIIRTADPGERITDHVAVTNLTAKPLTFTVYGTDAYTTGDGSFGLLAAAQQPTDLGSWITLGAREFTVPANTRLDVPFAVTVPEDATPGDHAGGVVASISREQTGADGQQVLLDRRVAARVYLTVSGAVAPALTIDSVRLAYTQSPNPAAGGDMTVTYRVRNTGNLRLSAAGTVRVDGPFGWELARTDALSLPELLPGTAVDVTETITGVQPAVRLAATVSLTPSGVAGPLPAVSRSTGVWAWPWVLWVVLGVLLLWTLHRVVKRLRASRRASTPAPSPAPAPQPVP